MSDVINSVLNLSPVVVEDVDDTPLIATSKNSEEELIDDLAYARENIYDIIGKSQEALGELMMVAQSSQHPRAYEVLNQMLKTMADINKDLIELHKSKKELTEPEPSHNVTNNNLMLSTADFQKMISGYNSDNNT